MKFKFAIFPSKKKDALGTIVPVKFALKSV